MTDQQAHRDNYGMDLIVHRHYAKSDQMVITTGLDAADASKRYSTSVPTTRLLSMIDTIDPDAMRAYLRERSDLMDSPHDLLTAEDLSDRAARLQAAADARAAVPEADSPEDTDERVPPREALLTDAQERRLYLIEQLTKTLPADESPALAHWIITGRADLSEDLTLSGDAL